MFIVMLLLISAQFCIAAQTTVNDIWIQKAGNRFDIDYEEYCLYGASISGDDRIAILLRKHGSNEWFVALFGSNGEKIYGYRLKLSKGFTNKMYQWDIYFDNNGRLHCVFSGKLGESIFADFSEEKAVSRIVNADEGDVKANLPGYIFSWKMTNLVTIQYNRNLHSTMMYEKIQPYILTVSSGENQSIGLFFSGREYRLCKRNSVLEPVITFGTIIVVIGVLWKYKIVRSH